ncbi:cytochrome P450 [Nesidiocoris tenuis]|uniref:Cytochrome P450 n=1 Tax=Nesidiocoris tenuis TaxID=355587 RepID=A0ABN7AR31_9HEMI|nr:cytochrome P450 [Nesidiocoris tenuis]
MYLWLFACALTLIWWFWRPLYWTGSGLKYVTPYPVVGSCLKLITSGNSAFTEYLYNLYPEEKIFGIHFFWRPTLIIRDFDTITDVMVRDFDHFTSNTLPSNQEYDMTGGNLLFLHGMQWKEMRNKISPFFTPAKVKAMLASVDVSMPKAVDVLENSLKTDEPLDVGNLLTQITVDVITQACFGIESDSFEENSKFRPLATIFFSPMAYFMLTIKQTSRTLFKYLRLQSFDLESSLFVKKITRDLVEHRRKNNARGNDFVQGIIEIMDQEQLKKNSADGKIQYFPDGTRKPKYDFDELFLQALIVFIGGVETTATTMTWLFYELAHNQDIQDACREEILDVVRKTGRPVGLESQNEIPTVTGAINEALRLHPAFPFNGRVCTKTYKFRNVDLTIEPGQSVLFPLAPLQKDPNFFSDPNTFDPQRWRHEKPSMITAFGLGPRQCLGKSFSMQEMILVVARLLQNYKFTLHPNTPIPPPVHKTKLASSPEKPIMFNISRVEK